jgi:type VI secretion system VasD/TssJ family lipoprotein
MTTYLRFTPVLLVAAATGCGIFGKGGESTPSPLDVVVTAAPRLNPDERGESLPTLVRLIQLKSAGKLESADFDQIVRRPTGMSWRTVVELPPPDKGGRFAFFAEGYRIERK